MTKAISNKDYEMLKKPLGRVKKKKSIPAEVTGPELSVPPTELFRTKDKSFKDFLNKKLKADFKRADTCKRKGPYKPKKKAEGGSVKKYANGGSVRAARF